MHRYPENSFRALEAALQAGAKYIEFDIQMNASHEFVALHDADFERTSGKAQSVFETDAVACKAVSVHQPDRFGQQYFPTPVSSLQEILELTRACPGANALVEIKGESVKHWGLKRVMERLLAQLAPYQDCCMLMSFSDTVIEYAQAYSQLKTGWIFEEYTSYQRKRAAELKPDFLMTNYQLLAEGERPWSEFSRWMLYDVMDRDRVQWYFDAGVELVETANIGEMLTAFPAAGRRASG
jgi:glycerophosphoryl diester phosphodiesterase